MITLWARRDFLAFGYFYYQANFIFAIGENEVQD